VPVQAPLLSAPTEGDDIVGDYATMGLTLRRHPLALLREKLKKRRIRTATEVAQSRNGQFIRAAGIVTCRQRPATASGVIFVTLEDETGYVNVIVWNDLADRQRKELIGSRLLEVSGELQREGRVVHILARRLADLSPMLGRLSTSSHDFH
jgi:error-prone DNA polymerase